jgi:hypothetical protein
MSEGSRRERMEFVHVQEEWPSTANWLILAAVCGICDAGEGFRPYRK